MKDKVIVSLVAAAGRGIRFSKEMPKSFYPVQGKPLLVWSLDNLVSWGGISKFIVMVPPGWVDKAREFMEELLPGNDFEVLTGGETRQESVAIGLSHIGHADFVMVHDACRPFVSSSLISNVVMEAEKSGAAVPVLQVTETLARLRGDVLDGIVPREKSVTIQTPQVFRLEVLKKAFNTDDEIIRKATDESSLIMESGHRVTVVEGERWNIKVTVKEDLQIIKSFLTSSKLELTDEGGK
jgi:2-C-methyl-D-erythritol 4-phosphate cytidylyltransferase